MIELPNEGGLFFFLPSFFFFQRKGKVDGAAFVAANRCALDPQKQNQHKKNKIK